MPSIEHEVPLSLLRSAPGVLRDLLRSAFGIDPGVPGWSSSRSTR